MTPFSHIVVAGRGSAGPHPSQVSAPFSATACEMKINAAKAKSKADVITAAYGALGFDLLQA